jgi:hypothetical protein
MAKTLFIVDDEDFQNLPAAAQKKLLSEVTSLLSFIPGFTVKTLQPLQFKGTEIHFTDSVVELVGSVMTVSGAASDIQKVETENVKSSIKDKRVNLTIDAAPQSFAGDPDRGGIGGHWKTVVPVGRQQVSIGMTYGVASLEFAEDAYLDVILHGRKADDIRREQREKQRKDSNWLKTKDGQQSTTDLVEAELLSRHKPLREWPRAQWEDIATALARIVAHEARHQYLEGHSSAGLGADSPRVWGDPNFEAFDGTDQANIVTRIDTLNRNWDSANVHLETCPLDKASPFAQ